MGERRGTKGLELWCRRITEGYPGVKVDNMTTSWRDGLAFCALIHHFRPDLIEFSSLKKEDVYSNNELAFRTAEAYLGIPALLDAEDMARHAVPDRLSILTYLSQYYQHFSSSSGSSPSRTAVERSPPSKECDGLSPTSASAPTAMSGGGLGRRDPCTSCGLPVFLAQRLKVERRLYHRTCFRCARCNTQLTLANCYQTEIDGQFCCETCPDEDSDINDYQADDTDSQKSYVQSENNPKISQSALFGKEDNNTVILNKIESHELNVQDFSSKLPTKINDKDKPSAASVALSGFMKSQFDHSTANDDNTLPALPKNCPPKNVSLNNSSDSFDFLTGPQLSELNETHHIGNKKFKNNENHTNAMIISHTSNSSASLKRIDKKISTIDSVVSDTSENNKQYTASPCIIESKDIYSSFNKNNDNSNLVKDSLFTGIKYRESVIPTQEDIKSSTQNVNIEDLCYVNQPETASVIENINDSNLSEGADSVNSFKYGVLAKDNKKEIRSSNDKQNVMDNVDTMNDITKPNQSIVKMRMKIFERDSLTNHGKAKDPTVSNQIKIENLIPENHQSNKVTSADKASSQDLNVAEDKNNTVNNDFGNIDARSKEPPKQIEEVLSEDTIHKNAKIEEEDTICAKIEIEKISPEDTTHENIVEVLSEDTTQEKVFPEDSSHENIKIEGVLPEYSSHESIEIERALPEDSSHENIEIEGVLPEFTTHEKTKNNTVLSETISENMANSHNLAISQLTSVNNRTEISEDDDILNSDNRDLTENIISADASKIPQNIFKEEISTGDDYSHVSELKVYEAVNKEIVFNKDSLPCMDAMELNKLEALNKKTEDLEDVHSESTIDEFINIANEDCLSIKETGKNLDDGQYPEHLNPFSDDGSDESEVELSSKMERKSPKKTKDKLNPFDSSSDEDEKYTTKNDGFDPTPRKKSAEKPPRPPLPAVLINASKLFDSSSTSTKSDVPSSLNLNPFSDDDDSDADSVIVGKSLMLSQKSLNDDSSSSLLNISTIHGSSSLSLASSVTKRKKAPAPKPPGVESIHTLKINNNATDVNNDHQNISITSNTSSQNSSINHISPQISPRPLKRKPAPPPPTVSAPIACSTLLDNSICDKEASSISESTYSSSVFQEERSESVVSNNKRVISAADFDNDPDILTNSLWDSEKLRIDDEIKNTEAHEIEGTMSTFSDKSTSGQWKRRKGPAPAIPLLQKRSIGLSMPPALLRKELQMLEAQQRGLERQGVRLEEIIREKCENNVCSDESSEPDPETDELVLQLFELVNEKNDLFRKQAELMYIRRQQRLEEEYADLEHQIRISIAKPDANKTDSDKAKEEQLIQRLVEVVERRNEVVTCLEMDRLREREEDKSIRERMASHRAKRNESQSKPPSPDLSEGSSKKEKKKRWIKKEKLKKEGTSKISPDQESEQINVKKEKKLKKWF